MRLSVAIVGVLLVAGCSEPVDALGDKVKRSSLVKVCSDGSWIGRDPQTGDLVAVKAHWYGADRSTVAPGTDLNSVCAPQ